MTQYFIGVENLVSIEGDDLDEEEAREQANNIEQLAAMDKEEFDVSVVDVDDS